jgi:hypothetical protein
MNAKNLKFIQECVDNEGFDYAFRHYSRFEEIKDPEFHKLRVAYVEAAKKLAEYIREED